MDHGQMPRDMRPQQPRFPHTYEPVPSPRTGLEDVNYVWRELSKKTNGR